MKTFTLFLLLFQLATNVTVTNTYMNTSILLTTTCSTRAQTSWDGFGWVEDPYEVTAANTSLGGGCLMDSASYPTPSLP